MARILQYIEWVIFCAEPSCEMRSVTEAEECLVEICSINDDDLGTVSPSLWAIVMTGYRSSDDPKELLNDFSPVGAFLSHFFPHSQPVDCCS